MWLHPVLDCLGPNHCSNCRSSSLLMCPLGNSSGGSNIWLGSPFHPWGRPGLAQPWLLWLLIWRMTSGIGDLSLFLSKIDDNKLLKIFKKINLIVYCISQLLKRIGKGRGYCRGSKSHKNSTQGFQSAKAACLQKSANFSNEKQKRYLSCPPKHKRWLKREVSWVEDYLQPVSAQPMDAVRL